MIRYRKSRGIPSSLRRGVAENALNCAAYDADNAAYRSGDKKFEIKKSIYGTDVVKDRLKKDQHNKCGFCEAIFDANAAGDVEHYRPKTAVTTDAGRIYPGYYWVGYDWSNLSYACPDCNGYRKRDLFPLAPGTVRALSHNDDMDQEQPLVLDPYGLEDPRQHIRFCAEAPESLTVVGKATIEVLALDRTNLARDRLQHLRYLQTLHKSVMLLEHDQRFEAIEFVARMRAELKAATEEQAKFSAASEDYLKALDAGKDQLP